jgi:hypothetical protein
MAKTSAWKKRWSQKPHVMERHKEQTKRYRELFPEKASARSILAGAVRRGKVNRLPCEVCGNPKSEAHHEDYSKPLEVIWLCREHHLERHPRPRKRVVLAQE